MLRKAELSDKADSENYLGGSSETMYFIGLDVHKKTISYCVKDASGQVLREGKIRSYARRTGQLDEDSSSTLERSHGSHDLHGLDL